MKIIQTPSELISWRKSLGDETVGFVATMGALHAGHERLLYRSRLENNVRVLSIFVNPTQFNDPKDFTNYPKTWEADLATAERNGVEVIFAPIRDVMYPDGYKYKVIETDFSTLLCGKDRPGHFDGVLTVVMKLLNVVRPDRAYFGEKDYQQLSLIREMVQSFFMGIDVVSVPTLREKSGLAFSSRNTRLSSEELAKAPLIHRLMTTVASADEVRAQLTGAGFRVDYVTDREGRRFVAAHLGAVRLIDNVELAKK